MAAAALPLIVSGAGSLLGNLFGFLGAGKAGRNIADAGNNAVNATANATNAAVQGIVRQQSANEESVNNAGISAQGQIANSTNNALSTVNQATGGANDTLSQLLGLIQGGAAPYQQGGAQGIGQLAQYAQNIPQFNFNPGDISKMPGYQAVLQGGQEAIQNTAAARGLGQGGAVLKDLTSFGQNLAGTYYQNLFNQAQSQFQTNQNATLNTLQPLIGAGLTGQAQANQGIQNLGGQQAQSTLAGGIYGGNALLNQGYTNAGIQTDLAKFLASLGTQSQEAAGQIGLAGNVQAGQFGLQGAQGAAAANAGQYGALGAGANNLGNIFGSILKLPGIFGSGGTSAYPNGGPLYNSGG